MNEFHDDTQDLEEGDEKEELLTREEPTLKPSTQDPQRQLPNHRRRKARYTLLCLILALLNLFVISAILSRAAKQERMFKFMSTLLVHHDGTSTTILQTSSSDHVSTPLGSVIVSAHERQVIEIIYWHLIEQNPITMMEIFKGAHVIVRGDQGEYYHTFQTLDPDSVYVRMSSHFSKVKQVGITQGSFLTTLLCGETPESDTWFQFESAPWNPWGDPLESLVHVLNYLEYIFRGVQIGPLGTSVYTDASPLIVTYERHTGRRMYINLSL